MNEGDKEESIKELINKIKEIITTKEIDITEDYIKIKTYIITDSRINWLLEELNNRTREHEIINSYYITAENNELVLKIELK